jgi:NADPH-dependent 2,4-dienoyl-CoA reductase/sulfur reductase-like enzyme
VNVVFNTAAGSIAPSSVAASATLSAVAEERGITVNTGFNLIEVDSSTKEAVFDIGGGNLQVYDFDLLHVTPPTAPGSMKGTPFADSNGVIAVEDTLQTKFDNVFAIGPCTSASESTVYGMGAQAAAVVENIDATEAGQARGAASGYSAFPVVSDFDSVTFEEDTPALSGLNMFAKLPLVSPETIGSYVHFDYLSNGGFADGGASSYPAWSKGMFVDRDLKLSKPWLNLPGDVHH